jgi:hypothetical protein
VGWRLLTFIDDTQARVKGLDEILADVYLEGRPANDETAELILNSLEARNNYIPSSDRARREYAYILLKEYKKFITEHAKPKFH